MENRARGQEREISEESVRIIWAKDNVGLSTGNCRQNEEGLVFKRAEAVNDRISWEGEEVLCEEEASGQFH